MLIEFEVENFRSFKGRQVFSMVAGVFPEHADSNTFDPELGGFDRLVRSAVVYGANAAGKTNLLRAIQFVKALVLNSASAPSSQYPHNPFKFSNTASKTPSRFQITFARSGIRYEYGFTMGPTRIEAESLIEHTRSRSRTRGRTMFERSWNKRAEKYDWKFSPHFKGQRVVWSESTRPDALFLSTAVQLNSDQLRPAFEWFQKQLIVVVDNVSLNESLTLTLFDEPKGKERLIPFLREADLGIADVTMRREQVPPGGLVLQSAPPMIAQRSGSPTPEIITITLSHLSEGSGMPVGLDFNEESSGTQILFKMAGAWLNAISNSEVLLIDEIDRSLHPFLTRFLIKKFHSSITNSKNAQLLCTTHNTSLLHQELFRRDQVWFTEKDRSGASKLYPLTTFSPRNDEVLERWYMRGRYGAVPVLTQDDE
jgi:hypothetical protein